MEFSVGVEINYMDFNLHESEKTLAPYLFLGAGIVRYNLFYHEPNSLETIEYGKGGDLVIPAIVGIKSNISPFVILGLEIGARYTLSDNLDGSAPETEASIPQQFKNLEIYRIMDWYVFYRFNNFIYLLAICRVIVKNDHEQFLKNDMPKHLAIIMDGNGRWAEKKRQKQNSRVTRTALKAVQEVVEEAVQLKIETLDPLRFFYRKLEQTPRGDRGVDEVTRQYPKK